jgi:hypothetical protein
VFLDGFHFQDLFLDDSRSPDCLEFRDASLPDGSPDSRSPDGPAIPLDGLVDSPDNPADRSQDGCTQAG